MFIIIDPINDCFVKDGSLIFHQGIPAHSTLKHAIETADKLIGKPYAELRIFQLKGTKRRLIQIHRHTNR